MSSAILLFIATSVKHHFTGTASSQARLSQLFANFKVPDSVVTSSARRSTPRASTLLLLVLLCKDLSSAVYVHHRSLVVQSQYSDLPSGATLLSSGSHTTAADFLLSYFCLYTIYALLAASSSSCSSAIPLPAHSIHFYSELAF